ncbi:hypothetical protein J6590_029667 [Homalodisca vitripennis]|nr:hypothetical protein J6590_029667 [Homalodisca vitripennis]
MMGTLAACNVHRKSIGVSPLRRVYSVTENTAKLRITYLSGEHDGHTGGLQCPQEVYRSEPTEKSVQCHREHSQGTLRPEISFKHKHRAKRDFSTRHLNMSMDSPIYLNESLTPKSRLLLKEAHEYKKTNNHKWLWVQGGRIYLKREDNGPIIKCQMQV